MSQYRMAANGHLHLAASPCSDETCRAVVVISPEDREQVERLARDIEARHDFGDNVIATSDIQAALRSLLAPPKPPEPQGLGAVVEALRGGGERGNLTRVCRDGLRHCWVDEDGSHRAWRDLSDVRVLSEGVTL